MNLTSILRLPFIFSSDDYSGRFQLMCEISKRGNIKSNSGNYRYSMISKSLASKGIEYLCNTSPQGIIDFANSDIETEAYARISDRPEIIVRLNKDIINSIDLNPNAIRDKNKQWTRCVFPTLHQYLVDQKSPTCVL